MFNLIRRISGSVLPRQDRPWDDDATSTAPQKGRKRLLSTTDEDESAQHAKKARGDVDGDGDGESVDTSQRDETPVVAVKETEEVKEVREGVSEVEIADSGTDSKDVSLEKAAAVPLPEGPISGEEDEEVPTAEPVTDGAPVTKEGETVNGADVNGKDAVVASDGPQNVTSTSTSETPASTSDSTATPTTEGAEKPETVEKTDATQESPNRKSKRATKPRKA